MAVECVEHQVEGDLAIGRAVKGLPGDGHVLSLHGQTHRGEFSHRRWTVAGLGSDDIVNLLVTGHETHHAALNSGTAWGALLQANAIAAHLLPEEPRYVEALTALVGRCRRTHEAYATHCSLVSILNADEESSVSSLLAGFPAYRTHLNDAVAVGPVGPLSLIWRQIAAESALLVCMQPRILPLSAPLRQFRPSQLRDADSPDSRYTLLRRLGPRLWTEVDRTCDRVIGQPWSEMKRADPRDPDTASELLESLRLGLRQLCVHAATVLLDSEGRPTMSIEEVQQATDSVIEALSEALGTIKNPMVADPSHRLGLASLYDLERIELHPPLVARVRPTAAVDPTCFVSNDAPDRHIFVVGRRADVLRQQFRLVGDPWQPNETVCAVQVSRIGPDGNRIVDLYPMMGPDELTRLLEVPTDRGVLASVAVSGCRDTAWRDLWLPALNRATRLTMLLDLPFLPSIDALVDADLGFRYVLARIPFAGGAQYVFGCSIRDEPPLLGLCSLSAGQAFAEYASRRSGGQAIETLEALGADRSHLPLIVAHLVLDESYLETMP